VPSDKKGRVTRKMRNNGQDEAGGRVPAKMTRGNFAAAARRYWPVAVTAAAAALVAALCLRDPPATRIDTAVIAEPRRAAASSAAPLRVAVSAMISPERTGDAYSGLVRLLGERLGRPVEILQRKTYAEINDLLERREIELALVCSGAYVDGKDKFGMELLAIPIVNGRGVYYSYIIVPQSSPVKRFDELRGKRFAFTDPQSNSGKLVPTYMLATRGETPRSYFSDSFFTYSHDNSITAVAEGLADGAAVDSLIWDYLDATGSVATRRTRIIEKSPPYGIPPFVVHPDTEPEMKARLRSLFLGLHRDPQGAALLKEMQIERFEPGSDSAYDSVRQMERWIAARKGAA
jgi:phosphonate transport system substrate-binding protein